jgi:putative endonuclease
MQRLPCVYIMANKRNGTLYTGVTSNLAQRAWQHREGQADGFTRRYGCKLLVYYEPYETMLEAIAREKQIKAGSRAKKLALIECGNREWKDLYEGLV